MEFSQNLQNYELIIKKNIKIPIIFASLFAYDRFIHWLNNPKFKKSSKLDIDLHVAQFKMIAYSCWFCTWLYYPNETTCYTLISSLYKLYKYQEIKEDNKSDVEDVK